MEPELFLKRRWQQQYLNYMPLLLTLRIDNLPARFLQNNFLYELIWLQATFHLKTVQHFRNRNKPLHKFPDSRNPPSSNWQPSRANAIYSSLHDFLLRGKKVLEDKRTEKAVLPSSTKYCDNKTEDA